MYRSRRNRGVVLTAIARNALRAEMKQFGGRATVERLAELANLSPRTVTNLLNGRPVDRSTAAAAYLAVFGRLPAGDDVENEHDQTIHNQTGEARTAINFFDDVQVYADERVFLDEDFDDYEEGATRLRRKGLRMLIPFWSGKEAYVTREVCAPGSAPASWASVAYPNWNCQDVVELTPDDVPPGTPLIFEASVYMPNPDRGVMVGLTRPYQRDGDDHQFTIATVTFDRCGLTVNGIGLPRRIQPCRWYRVAGRCDLERATVDVLLDDQVVATCVPMDSSGAGDFRFTHFVIAGVNFVNRP